MRKIICNFGLFAAALIAAGCSDSADDFSNEESGIEMCITRAGDAGNFDFNKRVNRIYLANREPEHDADELHCIKAVNVKSGDGGKTLSYRLTKLLPQWYKVSVLSVPKADLNKEDSDPINSTVFTEQDPSVETCDMNKKVIDYYYILAKGAGCEAAAGPGNTEPINIPLSDGDIYREIQNIWTKNLKPGEPNPSMNFTLTRVNGRLDVDMGILADQFEDKVSKIRLELETPTRMYITDNDKGDIKTTDRKIISFETNPYDMRNVEETKRKHHIIHINMLPGILKGKLMVNTTDALGAPKDVLTYTLDGYEILIKENIITTVKFNGIQDYAFDVKYAGYENTNIDVEDEWNGGWQ